MNKIKFSLNTSIDNQNFDTLIVPTFTNKELPTSIEQLGLTSALNSVLKSGDFKSKPGEVLFLNYSKETPCQRVGFVGFGDVKKLTEKIFISTLKSAAKSLKNTGATNVISALNTVYPSKKTEEWSIYHNTFTIQQSYYEYTHSTKAKKDNNQNKLSKVCWLAKSTEVNEKSLKQAYATAISVSLTKNLANMPSNYCTPTYLANTAISLAKEYGFISKVLNAEDAKKLGMGAFLAVAQGSENKPKFITLNYQGADKSLPSIALVGKGVTFDTGGISLKPGQSMDEMKYDMSGAATVLGVFKALGMLKPKINVVGIIPSTDNMPDAKAVNPGDVVKSLSGQTIEILNTDAEGRLILCDAITYAQQNFNPSIIIDIATLTGACVIALGNHISGIMGNDEDLTNKLLHAGKVTYDKFWQLPLGEEFDEQLKSNFADMANIGGRAAGTITAAQFLKRFINNGTSWAHCDIAGTAWVSGENKGATGRPVPALIEFLLQKSNDGI